ncbi:hypothetical protein ABEB36_001051 [Hypothenemus hampei]|uniref:TPX2 C-terminal domain-containing protein n=1 Tax=Hypothenemus hampei TaxID=57062 RepID=A0ABD1FE64_HYPHA
MSESFDFMAKQFVDFEEDDVFVDKHEEDFFGYNTNTQRQRLRKSLSVGNLTLYQEYDRKEVHDEAGKLSHSPKNENPKTSPIYQGLSMERLNLLAQPKQYQNTLEMPMAEAVNQFQRKTPSRFRSKPNQLPQRLKIKSNKAEVKKDQGPLRAIPVSAKSNNENQSQPSNKLQIRATVPQPFSFESRDKQIEQKRQNFIKKILDEEKKARTFHANPVPTAIKNRSRKLSSSSCGSNKNLALRQSPTKEFKARPAVVLHQEPFVPRRAEKPPTEFKEFALNTEKRRDERKYFEKIKQEKEDLLEILKKRDEELRLLKEKELAANLRKQAGFKAKPIGKYKPVVIHPSEKVTIPVSPKINSRRNKENIPQNS